MRKIICSSLFVSLFFALPGCKTPNVLQENVNANRPSSYLNTNMDTANSALVRYRELFKDPDLLMLIDSAIKNNWEAKLASSEIDISKNEILFNKARLAPIVNFVAETAVDKVGRYTSEGAGNASTEMEPGKKVPEPLPNQYLAFQASWEADIWGKLHAANKSALQRYLSSVEGRNFLLTNLIAEVASSYYELQSLDQKLTIIRASEELQKKELEIVKVQKEAALVTELAVKQFEATLFNTEAMEYPVMQAIAETENKINFLIGRYPTTINRAKDVFTLSSPAVLQNGIPSQLLLNRPDLRAAEHQIEAAKLDVKAARAEFYPSVELTSLIGTNAFKPSYLVKMPESLAYSLLGGLASPLLNKRAIKAEYLNATIKQKQAVYDYEQKILNAFNEVSNLLSAVKNNQGEYQSKSNEVQRLNLSTSIAYDLFKAGRANYLEVLVAQRDALSAQIELVEKKRDQWLINTNLYRALGGGWR